MSSEASFTEEQKLYLEGFFRALRGDALAAPPAAVAVESVPSGPERIHREAQDRFIAECRALRLICGLAGSIAMVHVPRLRELAPDVVGVRGALCAGGRNGRLDPLRLRSFLDALSGRVGPPVRTTRRRSGPARLRGGSAA